MMSAFVFAKQTVPPLLISEISSFLSSVQVICVEPSPKLRRPVFSHHGSYHLIVFLRTFLIKLKLTIFRY